MSTKFCNRTDIRAHRTAADSLRRVRRRVSKPSVGIIFALLACLPALANKKDDKFSAAQAAANAGRVDEATRLFCEVAQEDPAYRNGEAKQNCNIMTQEAAKEAGRNDERFADGVRLFNSGDYDGAEQKFKNVKNGVHLAEATSYLTAKIPAARQAAKAAGDEAAMSAKFDQGVQAYQANNFTAARALLGQVAGKHQADAQSYLKKIQQFEQAKQQGDNLANSKNYRAAIESYNDAAAIKGDGPGDPRGKVTLMQALIASASGNGERNSGGNGEGNGSGGQRPAANNVPPTRQVVAAVMQPTHPRIDVEKLLRDAQSETKRGNTGAARGKYLAVLAEDPKNGRARVGLEALPKETGPSQQKAGEEADIMLAKGISEFYTGQYEDAEVHIKDYIEVNGGKSALGYFYRGASRLTRYYLGGDLNSSWAKRLLSEAQGDFRMAKKTPGFKPPDKIVSPKIVRIYQEVPAA
jgi:hypothetical protein